MTIIHGVNDLSLPRLATASLTERLATMSAWVVTGARQTGKSTLAQHLARGALRRPQPIDPPKKPGEKPMLFSGFLANQTITA